MTQKLQKLLWNLHDMMLNIIMQMMMMKERKRKYKWFNLIKFQNQSIEMNWNFFFNFDKLRYLRSEEHNTCIFIAAYSSIKLLYQCICLWRKSSFFSNTVEPRLFGTQITGVSIIRRSLMWLFFKFLYAIAASATIYQRKAEA